MVECQLPKLKVAGSTPVSRSIVFNHSGKTVENRRAEQLATETRFARCGGNHQRTHWVDLHGDEPMAPWPERERGGRCVCGAELEFHSIVDVLHP